MAIDGESFRDAKFFIQGEEKEITLKVRDIVLFKILESIRDMLGGLR